MKISKLGIIKNCNVTRLVNSNFIRYYKIKILFHKEKFLLQLFIFIVLKTIKYL